MHAVELNDDNVAAKSCPTKRRTNAYNLFCSTMLNSGKDSMLKLKYTFPRYIR